MKIDTSDHSDPAITTPLLEQFRIAFDSDPRHRVARNAVTKTTVNSVAMNRDAVTRHNHTFSHVVKAGKATHQKQSGRCWMFAGLNTFRMAATQQMNVEDFELSQNYLMFWDKLEKANHFLENILATLEEPVGSRIVDWLVANPLEDGGQWDMFANLVKKYGVVPKEAMPETDSSSSSGPMNSLITLKLREYAARLRAAHGQKNKLETEKENMLEEIYRMLVIHLGEPPREFLWQWRDKENVFHRDGVITPQQFFADHVAADLDGMVCLIHCPQTAKSYNTLYTVQYLGNVVGGDPVRYVNVELPMMKDATIQMLKAGKPVWFGCDVGKMFNRDLGLMDTELYDYDDLYGTSFGLNKADRLDYGQSLMTHAMVFTGVDLDDEDQPRKWRVENSWGDEFGDKGFMVMTDAWFDEYNYEVVIEKRYVPDEILALLDTEATVLPPWDPMGSLAANS